MSKRVRGLLACIPAALVGATLYYGLKMAPDSALRIMLLPHAVFTGIFYNTPLTYMEGLGYLQAGGTYAIGRECLGGNLIVMLFLMSACLFSRFFSGTKVVIWQMISLLGAVIAGILFSCARIIASIPFIGHPRFALLHTGIGMIMYFFALTIGYALLNHYFRGDKFETDI